jgi:hypothetical protein
MDHVAAEIHHLEQLKLFPSHSGEAFAVVRYTDQQGRRWQVDTNGAVAKVGLEMQRRLTNEHLLFDNVVSNGN